MTRRPERTPRRGLVILLAIAIAAALLAWTALRPEAAPPAAPLAREAPEEPLRTDRPAVPTAAAPDAPSEISWRDIGCLLPVVPTRNLLSVGVAVDVPGGSPVTTTALVLEEVLSVKVPFEEGAGLVTLPGYERAGFVWFQTEDGQTECYFPRDPIREDHGKLRLPGQPDWGGDGLRFTILRDRDQDVHRLLAADAEFTVVDVVAAAYTIQACRSAGRHSQCTDFTPATVGADQVVDVHFDLPEDPLLIPDFKYRFSDEGVVVTTVPLRSVAEEAGLLARDLILAIDGEDTRGMSQTDFEDRILSTDPAHQFELDVEHPDGSVETLTVRPGYEPAPGGSP